jgi:hypothetical protein
MKTVSFNTSWITAAVLATCFASANAMAQTAGGLPSPDPTLENEGKAPN